MTQQARLEALILAIQEEFNKYQAGTKTVEIADRLNDGAAGTTLAEITTAQDAAIATAVSALVDGAPANANTLNKLFLLVDAFSAGGYATTAQVDAAIQAVIGVAPAVLDTLEELATALGNDANFAATLTATLATKANSADTYTKTESDATFQTIAAFNAAIGDPDTDLVAIFNTGLL
jgi:hypothetical protein